MKKVIYEMTEASEVWIRKELAEQYAPQAAAEKYREILGLYERFLKESPDIGGKRNPMAHNFYGALSAFAYYEAMGCSMTPDQITQMCFGMMAWKRKRPVLEKANLDNPLIRGTIHTVVRIAGGILNRHKADGSWGNTWGVKVNPLGHKTGVSMHLIGCPIADFAKKNGYGELMPYFCKTDEQVMEALGGRLYREHTVAQGHEDCDYWIRNRDKTDSIK